jgi:hypothetical protein
MSEVIDDDLKAIPRSVSIRSTSRSASAKKFKMYEVPRPGKGFEETCFSLIGQGTTFCTSQHCKTSHQGSKFEPAPGDLFVAKTASTAFADPRTCVNFLTPDLLVDWNSNTFSLEKWVRLFMLVSDSETDSPVKVPISLANLEAKGLFAAKAEAHRTPGKRKADSDFTPLGLRASPYKRRLAAFNPDEESPFSIASDQALEVLRHLDEGLEKATHFMADLSDEQGAFAKEENMAI